MSQFFKENLIDSTSDNFFKYVNLFAEQFLPIINNDKKKFNEIISEVPHKSWRHFNREIRKACDQYCTDNNLMTHADFQKQWFYEGVMIGRVTHGAKAEWLTGDSVQSTKEKKTAPKGRSINVDLADQTLKENTGRETKFPYVKDGWMYMKDGAYRINKLTAEEISK